MKSKRRKTETFLSEMLILPDGRILVHNLTQPFAELLRELNPNDGQISSRVKIDAGRASRLSPSKNKELKLETGATPVLRHHELPN